MDDRHMCWKAVTHASITLTHAQSGIVHLAPATCTVVDVCHGVKFFSCK